MMRRRPLTQNTSMIETAGFAHVTDKPLLNPHLEMFVDGFRYLNDEGRFVTGFEVVTLNEMLVQKPLPPYMSAQEADLRALTEACTKVPLLTSTLIPGTPLVLHTIMDPSGGPGAFSRHKASPLRMVYQ
ncbi:hypothetical protein GDO78_015624 [Eleutherodactylus coqui]|uniref:Uncharacterized protein n=1 Tax=Eleutherodactylus coqui TaxID=57060 RepID=A0A8J6BKI4_ELECQ|nr:hypothetical protein GDO78_015624 [Eleutherodactylus coqui]